MFYFYNYTESNWIQSYKFSDQSWLTDSLNWDKLTGIAYHDYSFLSLICKSYFLNHYFFLAYASKLSFFDILFLNNNFYEYNILGFYNYFIMDLYLSFNSQFLQKLSYFSTNNQDSIILVLWFAPEVIVAFYDYFYVYYGGHNTLLPLASSCFDSYVTSMDYSVNEGVIFFFLFFLFSWFLIYFFYMVFILKWSNLQWNQFLRFYFYSFSISKDTRVQYETVIQTAIFFIFYWSMTIMSFDDDKEELIEYLDSTFFLFFYLYNIIFFL